MTKRTDVHRKGAIAPAEYEHVLAYSLATTQDGFPIPSIGVNCELDSRFTEKGADGVERFTNGKHAEDGRCCVIGLRNIARVSFSEFGTTGKCSVCGASFVYGAVWKHLPTGEHVNLGHECERKYDLLASMDEWELANTRVRATAAALMIRKQNEEDRAAFLAAHPEVAVAFEALEVLGPVHPERARGLAILSDLRRKFVALDRAHGEDDLRLVAEEVLEIFDADESDDDDDDDGSAGPAYLDDADGPAPESD